MCDTDIVVVSDVLKIDIVVVSHVVHSTISVSIGHDVYVVSDRCVIQI